MRLVLFVLSATFIVPQLHASTEHQIGYAKIKKEKVGGCYVSLRPPTLMSYDKDLLSFSIDFLDPIDICVNDDKKRVNFFGAYRGNADSNSRVTTALRFSVGADLPDCKTNLDSRTGFAISEDITLKGNGEQRIPKVSAGLGLENIKFFPRGYVCFRANL